MLIDDGEAVDGDACRHRLVAGVAHRAAGVVGAVAGHVDDAPVGGGADLRQVGAAEIERGADGGAADESARRGEQRCREGGGALAVADHRPIGDHLLLLRPRPFDEADGDRAELAGGDGVQHARIGDGGGIALALQLELVVIDAARHIRREHQRDIDLLGPRQGRANGEKGGDDRTGEDRSHRHLLDTMRRA